MCVCVCVLCVCVCACAPVAAVTAAQVGGAWHLGLEVAGRLEIRYRGKCWAALVSVRWGGEEVEEKEDPS